MDVRLEGIIDELSFVEDLRPLGLGDDVLLGNILVEQTAEFIGLEMEEMPRIIPDIVAAVDGAAIASRLVSPDDHEIVLFQIIGGSQAGNSCADDEIFYLRHTRPSTTFASNSVATAFAENCAM